ncbi:MAG: site-specific integrase [Eubacteriales bacterium]
MIHLRYKPLKSGKYSIYLDIFSTDEQGNRKRQYEFLKLQVSKNYSKINNVISEDRHTFDIAEDIRKKREMELAGEIKGLKTKQRTTFRSAIEYLRSFQLKTSDFHIKSLLFHLNGFTQNKDVRFIDITQDWLLGFEEHLSMKVSHNTVKHYLKMLRARINDAYRQDIITINPFDKFEMPGELEVKRTTLDATEVQTLVNTPFPSHSHVRLAFLFSCFTGLRISDIKALKWKEIYQETDGTGSLANCINIRPVKTRNTSGKMLKVPLTAAAVAILEEVKYEKNKSEEVFCHLPTGRNARNLVKLWGARSGIKKDLHFHVARHSFATISLTYGMDIYTVSKLLGHQDLRVTEIYAKIVDEKKRIEIQKLPVLR